MLTGRESLIRLVGKRRRFLPNRQSLLSSPIQSSLSLCKDRIGGPASAAGAEGSSEQRGTSEVEAEAEAEAEASAYDWVTCPVCGNTVRGENYVINSHLDTCLARGTKRKLSQRTLLQLNFCSRSKVRIGSSESDHIGTNFIQRDADNSLVCDTIHKLHDIGRAGENDTSHYKPSLNSGSIMQTYEDGSIESSISDDRINYGVDLPSLSPENEMPKYDMAESVDNMSGVVLETFIVGRRFGEKVELNLGASISLLRDPDNVKDPNAVKVLSADSGCCKVLGFLPRELAQYLSPLMDNYCLSFEGHITSVPEHALAIVPIQIMCQKRMSHAEKENYDLQVFKSLWKHAFHVVESTKTCPPSMTKYQQNFFLLIQEVLRSYPHLFTHDEKNFLETFTSLSDDSQRLFVRLYTRKGPSFRMSNISYPEISDCRQAVKGLSAAGYICSIESMKELHDDDL
uniref:Fanconi-associated nuclease n=1 Tax=Davidia involucrata TaxID=16924 RepID=A0A5B6YVN6_DAVIN